MSETGSIEDLAKIVAKDIFKWFKWDQLPVKDIDWKCEQEHHDKSTHPSDTVFNYIHPYSGKRVYLNTDLKSYKKNSITKGQVDKALRSLALSVECANVSADWQSKFYIDDEFQSDVIGLLFIYNHDNEYDKDFEGLMAKISRKKLPIAEGNEIVVFSPERINYLVNVVNDIKNRIADDLLPKIDGYTFYYPDLVLRKRHGEEWLQSATIELLTSPWLTIKHKSAVETSEGYLIYYNRLGNTVEEFIYFLDTLSHYQMLLHGNPIRLRFVKAHPEALNNFNKAKHEYLKSWGEDDGRERQLNLIEAGSVTEVISKFNPMEVGMRNA